MTRRVDVVLVCGGRWHDFDFARLQLLGRLGGREEVRTRVFEDYANLAALDAARLLVTYTCDVRPDAAAGEALSRFVARGGRWLALHGTNSAIDPPVPGGTRLYRTPRALGVTADVLGSQFLGHPPIAPYRVRVTRPGHPLVQEIDEFKVEDELYVCDLRDGLDIILHAEYEGPCPGFAEGAATTRRLHPVLYLRDWGAGQVLYFTLGHCRGRFDMQDAGIEDTGRVDRGSWVVPEFATLIDRALDWGLDAGPSEGPIGAAPSGLVSPDAAN